MSDKIEFREPGDLIYLFKDHIYLIVAVDERSNAITHWLRAIDCVLQTNILPA